MKKVAVWILAAAVVVAVFAVTVGLIKDHNSAKNAPVETPEIVEVQEETPAN